MISLINYIRSIVSLSEEAAQQLYELADQEHYAKNEHILSAGQRCNKIWFLKKGMVRKYHLSEGKEITSWIHCENDILTSLHSYGRQVPSEEYLQACEETEVIGISRKNSELLAPYPEYVQFSNVLMEREFANIDIQTRELNMRDAKGKYEYLQEIAPEIVKRAKLGHIASILGITQETLSRIRKG